MEQAENPSSSRGYYCHNCNNTISLPITNFLCPDCHQGFIEKLPDAPTSASSLSERSGESRDDIDADPLVVLNRVFDDLSNNLGLEVIMGGGESNARSTDNRPSSSNRRDATSNSSRPNDRRRGRNQYTGTFEQMLSEFMSRTVQNLDGNGPVLLVGNPGDYAWGREGLDTIVTQLLNQMDASGPPPLAKDKINELPFVSITAQQVSENIQCSVCWDSFKMTEKVRQLPCDHIYHDLCIVPWLELHGTCPICRKLLSEDNEARLGFSHTGGLEALLSDVHRLSILQRSYTPSNANRRNHIQCFRCRNYGHIARECTQPARNRNRGGSNVTRPRSQSRVIPLHEFLADEDFDEFPSDSEDYNGSDYENSSDFVICETCGLSSSEHNNFQVCSSEASTGQISIIHPAPVEEVSPNFAGYRSTFFRPRNDYERTPLTCYKCRKPGHIARECREYEACEYCHNRNHKSSDCWFAPDRSQHVRRYDRHETRANSSDWRNSNRKNWRPDDSGPSTSRNLRSGHENYRCFQCNEMGHIARNCKTPKREGRVRYCRVCGGEGHFARDCPWNL